MPLPPRDLEIIVIDHCGCDCLNEIYVNGYNNVFFLPQTAVGGLGLAMLATRLSSLDPIPEMGNPAIWTKESEQIITITIPITITITIAITIAIALPSGQRRFSRL